MSWYPNINNTELIDMLSKYIDLPPENIQYFLAQIVCTSI